jgi:hypothetical protein
MGTPTVLVTAFLPTSSELFDLLRTGALTGVADKSVDMLELAHSVAEFEVSRRFPNCVAQFRWAEGPASAFAADDWEIVRKAAAVEGASREDFAVLFRSLIPTCARDVVLKPITPGHGGAALFRSWVSSGDGPAVEEVAIKYGERNQIRSEAMHYDRHIGPLPDGVAAHLRWRKETGKLAAIAYSWVGDSVEDGLPFGPIPDPDQLTWSRRLNALDRLFTVSLNPWYTVYRSNAAEIEKPGRLIDYYTGPDEQGPVPFAKQPLPGNLPSPIVANLGVWDFALHGQYIDPVAWITEGEGAQLMLNRHAPCHGDLHVRNIFVLPDDSPRLIDFGDTSLGHVFRDFAALETSIRLTCCATSELAHLKLATDCASRTKGLGEHINYRVVPSELDHLRQTLVTTMKIRRAALDAVGGYSANSLKEYLFAVALRMLRYATGIADEVSLSQTDEEKAARIWHALYGAARAVQQAVDHG